MKSAFHVEAKKALLVKAPKSVIDSQVKFTSFFNEFTSGSIFIQRD